MRRLLLILIFGLATAVGLIGGIGGILFGAFYRGTDGQLVLEIFITMNVCMVMAIFGAGCLGKIWRREW